ncbi:PAS domain S-box protein (plasmid) [Deinococcus sp. KNUC1210]|uniref:PAS domain S-box protein n=1 Tax=Deinococcus sp. KNUC1210 TaxID=2917691 RepID=UPI001EF12096|nr:PAS domain S-box protein [Deinococcus sp. KNUC1210]ULH17614.1 PAS domain S-box protein [Deinococcus sp. KNUC1210]
MTPEERVARLEGLIDLIDGVVWEADPTSLTTTYINGRLEPMFGFSPEVWLSDPQFWESRLHPEDRERVLAETAKAMPLGQPFRLEYRLITASGRVLWLRDVITPVIENGRLVALGGVMIDITAQREAEMVTSGLRERLAKVFEATPVGISLSVAETGELLEVNRAFEQLTGFDRTEMVGHTLLELGVWPSAEVRQRLIADLESQPLRDRQVQLHHRSGRVLDVLVSYEQVEIGPQRCLLAITQDIGERLRAEAQVRHAEGRFRGLVQNSADMVTVLDADGYYLYVSPAVKRLHKVEPEEVMGLHVSRHVHRDDWPAVQADLNALLANPQEVRVSTYRQRDSQGRWWWIETTSSNQLHDPAVKGIVCNSRDVTDRRESEARLAASEGRFRSLVQNASDLITVVDQQGVVRYESPSVTALLGFTPDELVGQHVFGTVDPADHQQITEVFARVLAGKEGHAERTTFRALRQDGEVRWMEGVVTNLLANPHIAGVVINSRDVTERKLAEDALTASQQTFQGLFESSPDGIMLIEFGGEMPIVQCNTVAAAMNGYTPEELIGHSTHVMMPEAQRLEAEASGSAAFREMVQAQQHVRFECDHVRKDGSVFPVEVHLTLIEVGGRRMMLSVERDITERRAAEAALTASQQQVLSSERLASLGRLTAGLAHEINTPLAATMNCHRILQTLLSEYQQSIGNPEVTDTDHREIAAEALQALQEAGRTTARIGEFIRQMRGHTRDSAGGTSVFDVFRLASDTLAMVAHEARSASVALELERPHNAVTLSGDPGRFTQVLTNLVINAIHACEDQPRRGRVLVRLVGTDPLRLEVEDNGHGMSAEVMGRIFQPMFTTKGVGRGTGLGLSIVRDIMEGQFGGTISVMSQPNHGTTFTAAFPQPS